jgi:hypothetical protein
MLVSAADSPEHPVLCFVTGRLQAKLGLPVWGTGNSSLSVFSTASAHYANKDYEMTITAMIWLLSFPLVLFLAKFYSSSFVPHKFFLRYPHLC